jgi:hypothetical protein
LAIGQPTKQDEMPLKRDENPSGECTSRESLTP